MRMRNLAFALLPCWLAAVNVDCMYCYRPASRWAGIWRSGPVPSPCTGHIQVFFFLLLLVSTLVGWLLLALRLVLFLRWHHCISLAEAA